MVGISIAPAPEQTVNVSLHNELTDLPNVAETLDRVGVDAGIPVGTVMHLQVVLDEVLSNVIKYAWPDGGTHEFFVRIDVRDGGIEVTITDDGRPFNPLAQRHRSLHRPVAARAPGESESRW